MLINYTMCIKYPPSNEDQVMNKPLSNIAPFLILAFLISKKGAYFHIVNKAPGAHSNY